MACSVCGVGVRGGGADTLDPLGASKHECVGENHRLEHQFEACGVDIAGKCMMEMRSKPSKGRCCCSSCDSDRSTDLWGPGREPRQHQQFAKVYSHSTKQLNNEITCQLYLDRPAHTYNSRNLAVSVQV